MSVPRHSEKTGRRCIPTTVHNLDRRCKRRPFGGFLRRNVKVRALKIIEKRRDLGETTAIITGKGRSLETTKEVPPFCVLTVATRAVVCYLNLIQMCPPFDGSNLAELVFQEQISHGNVGAIKRQHFPRSQGEQYPRHLKKM